VQAPAGQILGLASDWAAPIPPNTTGASWQNEGVNS
jgi:hypothetical protein